MRISIIVIALFLFASSCHEKKPFFEKDKIFAASYGLGSVGSMGFWLYNDHRYRILSSGGIGGDYYSGRYSLNGDTITLNDLNTSCGFKYNRLLIFRYDKNDSSYWKGINPYFKWYAIRDQEMDQKSGLVFQLDETNKIMKEKAIILDIKMDSLIKNAQ